MRALYSERRSWFAKNRKRLIFAIKLIGGPSHWKSVKSDRNTMPSKDGARIVRLGIKGGSPAAKSAPHTTPDEWRAERRNVPPPMTSRALTSSARHTSSTVPTRPCQRRSLRDNEWRAIVRAQIAEVRHPLHSCYPTRGASSLPSAELPCCNLPTLAAHAVVRSNTTVGIRTGGIALDGAAHHHPLEHAIPGAPCRAPYEHLRVEPNPFGDRPINTPTSLTEAPGLALSAPDNRNGRLTENERRLASSGARTVRPGHNLRTRARASRAPKETREHRGAHGAPRSKLVNVGARIARPRESLRNAGAHVLLPASNFRTKKTPAGPLHCSRSTKLCSGLGSTATKWLPRIF